MADQVEVTKLNEFIGIGVAEDNVTVPKIVMYFVVEPGEGDEATGQGHVHTQIIVRAA